jgi:hypothetical protein
MSVWKAFSDGLLSGLGIKSGSGKPEEPAPSALPSEEPAPSTLPPAEPVQESTSNRRRKINKIILGVVAVFAALLLIVFVVHNYNKQKVGKSDNPAAQKAALILLNTIPVKGWDPTTGFSRDEFGKPWTDDVDVEGGHNGCDTRNDILKRDLSNVVTAGNCMVLSGVLHDPYTGKDIQFNREEGTDILVQVDHVVPLLDAWKTGAQQWDQYKRVQFANDPLNLLAVSGKANRQKKAGDVARWLPSNKDFRCDYVTRVVTVKAKYGLWVTQTEHDAASRILEKCASQTLPSSGVLPSSAVLPSTGVLPSSGILPSTGVLFPSSSAHSGPPPS